MIIKGCEQKRVWLFSLLCLALALSTFAGCAAVSGKDYLLDVILVLAMVSFVGTLALAKYLLGRSLDE